MMCKETECCVSEKAGLFVEAPAENDYESEINVILSKESQVPKFIYDYTPCKRVLHESSFKSSPANSFLKKLGHMSPFFTTHTKHDSSPLTPHTWQKLTSQVKFTKAAVPFERLFQQSEAKPLEAFELQISLPPAFHLDNSNGESLSWGKVDTDDKTAAPAKNPGAGCNCRNSKCLKLYCECLRKKELCVGCNCIGCENTAESKLRDDRVRFIEKKNPLAFQPLAVNQKAQGKLLNQKGCNCRRSNCLKNYCECHQFGIGCGEFCKCKDCKNVKEPAKKLGKKINKPKQAMFDLSH